MELQDRMLMGQQALSRVRGPLQTAQGSSAGMQAGHLEGLLTLLMHQNLFQCYCS